MLGPLIKRRKFHHLQRPEKFGLVLSGNHPVLHYQLHTLVIEAPALSVINTPLRLYAEPEIPDREVLRPKKEHFLDRQLATFNSQSEACERIVDTVGRRALIVARCAKVAARP